MSGPANEPVAPDGAGGVQPPPKTSAETLTLRAAPRRIVRFRRGVVIGGAAAGALAVAGIAWMALGPQAVRLAGDPKEPNVVERQATADAVANLPGDYSKVSATTPQLGPPLPGDLGRAIRDRQRRLAEEGGPSEVVPQQTAEDQAAAAEHQRLASQASQAREGGVLVQTTARAPTRSVGEAQLPVVPTESAAAPARAAASPDQDQNRQQRKQEFISQPAAKDIYNSHTLQTPASPYQVMAGSVIAASMITGLNSDLPGLVVAQVTENVFDSATGRNLLIPQGARLIGSYDSVVAFGQSRALLVWQRIILPDGSSIQIDNLPATDAAGYAGLSDRVDYHSWRLLKGVALSTLLGVGTELTLTDESDLVKAVRESAQQSASQAGQQIVTKNLNIQPTITVRPGWPLRVIVHKDLVLRPWAG